VLIVVPAGIPAPVIVAPLRNRSVPGVTDVTVRVVVPVIVPTPENGVAWPISDGPADTWVPLNTSPRLNDPLATAVTSMTLEVVVTVSPTAATPTADIW